MYPFLVATPLSRPFSCSESYSVDYSDRAAAAPKCSVFPKCGKEEPTNGDAQRISNYVPWGIS